jgi:hypothetical protein
VSREILALAALCLLLEARRDRGALGADPAVSRIAVRAGEACEPRRPECSIAAALDVLAPGGTLELSPGRHKANLVIVQDATLAGAGAGMTILDGGGAGRVLTIEEGARVAVRGVTVTGGRLDKELERDGGGIWNLGVLALERCEVTGNVAVDDGGGIRNDGTLTVIDSSVHSNQATRWGSVGGGIYSPIIFGSPDLKVIGSTISNNSAGDHGGGIWCEGPVTVVNSTISGNSAAHTGGGIRNNGDLTVRNSTIAFNRAGTTGGGVHHLGTSAILSNTVVAANSAGTGGADCHGLLASQGYNLIQGISGCGFEKEGRGDLLGADPKLAPLAANGGATPTHALLDASPAIDAGGEACEAADQRGSRRPVDGNGDGRAVCDVGAFEAEPTARGRE